MWNGMGISSGLVPGTLIGSGILSSSGKTKGPVSGT